MFRLTVLGSLSLTSDGGPLSVAALQKRRLGLLAVLAVAGERGMSRERLQSFLWPDSDAARSRHALDQLVYATRRALDADPMLIEGRDLKLDCTIIESDVARFRTALSDGRLDGAVSLYDGRLLYGVHLAGSRDLEAWIDAESARLEQQYQTALDTLAKRASSGGNHDAAVEWHRQLSASDPLSSRIAIGLVEELIKSGDAPGAIQHARAYQHTVRTDLGVEPDPRVEALITPIARRPVQPATQRQRVPSAEALTAPAAIPAHGNRLQTRRAAAVGISATLLLIFGLLAARASGRETSAASRTKAEAAYLRGVKAWEDRSKSALDSAVIYFRESIDIDPSYADAYSGLANAYAMIGYSGYRDGDAMFPKAKAAAERAIALDSTRAASYAALGMELTWERDFRSAERAYRKAISLDPKYATAHQWYGILLRILGDIPGSVRETRIAAELDPLSLQIQNNYATFLSARDPAAAQRHYQKVVGEEPDSSWVRRNPWLLTNMAGVYAANGKYTEALRFAQRAAEILPGHPRAMAALAGVYRAMGREDAARAAFNRSDIANPHYAAYRAMFYASLGDKDSAFSSFDRVQDWGIPILISLRGLKPLEGDPRYDALLRRLGMTDIQADTH